MRGEDLIKSKVVLFNMFTVKGYLFVGGFIPDAAEECGEGFCVPGNARLRRRVSVRFVHENNQFNWLFIGT